MSPNWFIGFPVHPGDWYEQVITGMPAGIKSLNKDDLHMTFAFFGPAGESLARCAWEAAIDLSLSPVNFTFGPIEPFGNPAKPSAFALTLDKGKNQAIAYMEAHQAGLLAIAGAGPEKYTPRPHITIARPPRSASDELRAEGIAWLESVVPPEPELTLDQLALYTWSDDRKKQQFKIVESVKLS